MAISAAPALVKVRQRIVSGEAPPNSSRSTRAVNTCVLPVPAEAASVKFIIGGGHVDGVINGGIAVAWLSAEGVPNELEAAGFAVYDADGTRIGGQQPVPTKEWPVD